VHRNRPRGPLLQTFKNTTSHKKLGTLLSFGQFTFAIDFQSTPAAILVFKYIIFVVGPLLSVGTVSTIPRSSGGRASAGPAAVVSE
jgi:hypothetical protein